MTLPLGANDKRKRGNKHQLPASLLSFHFPAEDFLSEAFGGWYVIVGFHRFEGAFQFVHQLGIEQAHAVSGLHAERQNAGKTIDLHHMPETSVQKICEYNKCGLYTRTNVQYNSLFIKKKWYQNFYLINKLTFKFHKGKL